MNKDNKDSRINFLFLFLICCLISLLTYAIGSTYSKYKSNNDKKEYCSYYVGYSQTYLDLYIKRNESTELLDYISSTQKNNPDITLLNIFLAKRASVEKDYSNIIVDVADICLQNKQGDFLKEIFSILKSNNIVRNL